VATIPESVNGQGVELVHREVREQILRGAIAPGEEISQVKLARQLGVSRTPLREALRLLQREGMVEGQAGRQFRVVGFSIEDMEELYIARLCLEAVGIRISTPLLDPDDIAELEATMAKMAHFAELKDYERWEVPHRAFHVRLVSRSGQRVMGLLAGLSDHTERYRRLYTTEGPRAWSVGITEHRSILDAVKQRDADEAAARLVHHLAHTVTSVIGMLDPQYDALRLHTAIQMAVAPLPESGE